MLAVDWLSNTWIVFILLLATAVLLLMEVLTPTFGVLIGVAIVTAGGAVFFAFRIGYLVGLSVLLGTLVAVPLYLRFAVRLLPKTFLGKKLLLGAGADATNQATPDADELAELVGKTGTTETYLRPSGVIRIDGRRINAVAEHAMIEKDQTVEVLRSGGTEVVVRRADLDNSSLPQDGKGKQ